MIFLFKAVVTHHCSQDGVRLMLLELLRRCEDVTTSKTRASSARLIKAFCSKSSHDYEQFHHDLVKALVHLFGDAEEEVLVNAHAALAVCAPSHA